MFALRSFYYHFFKSFWLTDAKVKMHAVFAKSFLGEARGSALEKLCRDV
jgi:hypothetical protein